MLLFYDMRQPRRSALRSNRPKAPRIGVWLLQKRYMCATVIVSRSKHAWTTGHHNSHIVGPSRAKVPLWPKFWYQIAIIDSGSKQKEVLQNQMISSSVDWLRKYRTGITVLPCLEEPMNN